MAIDSFKIRGSNSPEETPEPQLCQEYPSKIHTGWQGMESGLFESEYITSDYVPTILTCKDNNHDLITQEGTPRNSAENVSPSSEISVHFAPVIDEKSIIEDQAIKVVSLKDKSDVAGKWNVSHGGTKFTFVPDQSLVNNEEYEISITKNVKDEAGVSLEDERAVKFKVAEQI